MKPPLIIETIEGIRKKLNARILLGKILLYAPKVCISIGAIVFLWRLLCSLDFLPGATLFSRGYAIPIFLGLFAGAVPVIAAFGWQQRLKREDAALWLDERLETKGIFSAALVCLSDEFKNPFALSIVDNAIMACEIPPPIQRKLFPFRILFHRGIITLCALIFTGTVIAFWNPRSAELDRIASTNEKTVSSADSRQADQVTEKPEEKITDEIVAQNLFPEDKRLASLAQEALQNGDQAALDYLMKENGLKAEDLASMAAINEMKKKTPGMTDKQDSSQNAEKATGGQPSPESKENEEDGGISNPKQEKENSPEKKPASAEQNNNGLNSNQGQQNEKGEKPANVSGGGEGSSEENENGELGQAGKGNDAGTGSAQNTTSLASKTGKAGPKKEINFRGEGSPIEFVLPDKEAKATLMQAVPDAVRGAEAAMGNSNAPLDYESFVKFYFSTLSKEMQ